MQIRRRSPTLAPLLAIVLAIGCGAAVPGGDAAGEANVRYSSRVHKMPRRDSATITPNSAPAGAHLTYYGGPVIPNVKVVQVLYGSGTYASFITSTATPNMASFYGGVTNSVYMDWLSEYDTSTQSIGRGSFLSKIQIAPSSANNGSTIDDSQIQAEINAQISSGALPAPDANTIYMIDFPHGKTITQGGSSSCQAGGFCAYHGTFSRNGSYVYYGVLPDMSAGSGCDTGCGSDPSPFNNQTSVASHELIEAVTDAAVGLATSYAAPLAWYDQTNGEIGDICNAQQGTVTGGDGITYVVQKEFSNTANDCIVSTTTTTTNDFSVSVSPSSQSVNAGSSVSYSVATATTSGSAQTVSFSVSGLPSGVTGSFSPSSVSSGQSATLTLSASGSAASATATFTVTGSAASGSHAATASVTVVGSGGGGGGGAIANGDFEAGSLSGWTASGASESVVGSGCHGGTYCARLGSTSPTNGDSTIAQTFTAPTGATSLGVWYKETCPDTVTYDWALATLKDNTAGTTATVISKACTTNGWTQATSAVTAGHSYTLTLTSHDDNYSGDPTYTLFDDVAFGTSSTPPPATGGITNGGFESGSLTGWTAAGTTSVTTTAHAGSYAALLGSTSPTTTSTLVQTFTAPSGVSQLSLYYANNCPDTVTYDWVTVTLKDNTSGTTTTVVPKTCASSYAWTHAGASVTAGHSYTLTLTNRDDNYAGDPTYTLFDDVTLL